jgi:hypothetical protein
LFSGLKEIIFHQNAVACEIIHHHNFFKKTQTKDASKTLRKP